MLVSFPIQHADFPQQTVGHSTFFSDRWIFRTWKPNGMSEFPSLPRGMPPKGIYLEVSWVIGAPKIHFKPSNIVQS